MKKVCLFMVVVLGSFFSVSQTKFDVVTSKVELLVSENEIPFPSCLIVGESTGIIDVDAKYTFDLDSKLLYFHLNGSLVELIQITDYTYENKVYEIDVISLDARFDDGRMVKSKFILDFNKGSDFPDMTYTWYYEDVNTTMTEVSKKVKVDFY
jgi:hypothetical protein